MDEYVEGYELEERPADSSATYTKGSEEGWWRAVEGGEVSFWEETPVPGEFVSDLGAHLKDRTFRCTLCRTEIENPYIEDNAKELEYPCESEECQAVALFDTRGAWF